VQRVEPSISKSQVLLATLGNILPHLPNIQTVTSINKEVNKKPNSPLVEYLAALGRFCTRGFLLYKPGLLTFPFFWHFYPLFSIYFVKKMISKY
jgi:hypothetical protein